MATGGEEEEGGGEGGGSLGSSLESEATQLQLKTNFIFLVKYFRYNSIDMPNLYMNLTES
jgi:hypothetical protein